MPFPGWQNLDEAAALKSCLTGLKASQGQNFAVRLSAERAHCALDVSKNDIDHLFQIRDREGHERETHWLNFWDGEAQRDAITTIVKRYGVSRRLASLMYARRAHDLEAPPSHEWTKSAAQPSSGAFLQSQTRKDDLEKGHSHESTGPAPPRTPKPLGFGDVVDNLWHFCSVDRGPQYLYVGFNALFTVPGVNIKHSDNSGRPSGLRIWTSLLLCHDGTAVSIFEAPPKGTPEEYVKAMRFNVLNIFSHLSKLQSDTSIHSLMQVHVRPDPCAEHNSVQDGDSAALLFYYLFDDWVTTYALITQRHNPYRDQLESIRTVMFETADMDHVKSLDLVGRQLTALKLVYQSYELAIHRILKHNMVAYREDWESDDVAGTHGRSISPSMQSGMTLPTAAVDRFERLLDRIRLYALTEVEECLRQKESLVFMVCQVSSSFVV